MTVHSLWLRLRALVRREAVERELDDEVRFHLEMETEQRIHEGLRPEEARVAAVRAFGGVDRHKEASRDARGVRMIDELRQDTRFAVRTAVRDRAFAVVVILTLAVGIGANTAIFSVVNGVLLRPLPWREPERLVMVWENDRVTGTVREPASVPDFYDFREHNRVFSDMGMFAVQHRNLTQAGGEPERVTAVGVSHHVFDVLGVPLLLGRAIAEAEDTPGAEAVVLLTEEFWRSHLGGDPAVIGRSLVLDDTRHTIIGVVAAEADFPDANTNLWVPLRWGPTTLPRSNHPANVVARLTRNATLAGAQAEMTELARQLEEAYPRENTGRGVFVEPLVEVMFANVRPALLVLLGSVGLVLLIACANVANLLLARGSVRARELAVRAALGAGRMRLARQFLVEMLVLSFVAAIGGVLLAKLGLDRLLALAPAELPRVHQVAIDPFVLLVTFAVMVVVAAGTGLVPTWQTGTVDVQSALKAEGRGGSASRGRSRFRSTLVVTELALSVMLVIGAGLLIRSFWTLRQVDPGFHTSGVLKAEFSLPDARYPRVYDETYPNWPRTQNFQAELLDRLNALPGVTSAALAAHHPLAQGWTNSFLIVGREAESADFGEIPIRPVSPEYFTTVGLRLVRGRSIEPKDRADAPHVGVVNEAAVRRFFGDTDPIGQSVRFWGITREIVGVVANERFYGITAEAPPALYTPIYQTPMNAGSILVRTSADPQQTLAAVRMQVREIDSELALYEAYTMEQTLSQSLSRERFTMLLLAVFAAIAVALALLGVHGVLSYTVSQRTRELGIRVALGASRREVVGMVVGQAMRLAALGSALGALGALAGTRLLASLLFGISTTDAVTFAAVIAAIACAALGASFFPALRATRVSAMMALRAE
jgi:predicted permease